MQFPGATHLLVFARSPRQAEKYEKIAFELLENELKLVVNRKKTQVTSVYEGVPYLGFVIYRRHVGINPQKIKAFKDTIRKLTPRNHGMNVEAMVKRLNPES